MPVVRMHIGESEALEAAYEAAAVDVREAVASLSPLVTQALALLDQPGQNPVYGPMPALTTAASGLGQDGDDVAWRIDLLRASDSRPLDVDGRVIAFTPTDLPAAFRQAGLTPEEVEVAEDMMRNGVSFVHASQAAKSSNPEAALDRILLTEVEDRIANWSGTDNDPLLDQLVAELHEIEARMAERADEFNDQWMAFRRQEAESWVVTEWTPLETAERSLAEISDVLDTAKHDRGRGVGATVADGIWSTEDLEVVIANEHGYYTASQVAHAETVLAMATSSPEARDHLGITQSGDGWSFSDIGHLTLDVFGMVPVVGNAADGINAAWYAAEGDYLNAALSSVALVPAVGQAVTIAKPAILAASAGIVFKSLDEAMAWARRWLEARGILKAGDEGIEAAEYLYRGDNFPHSSAGREPGRLTSHVDPDSGSLIPANPDGASQVHHHIRGAEPSKSDSPLTSFSDSAEVAERYGDHMVTINRTRLEADIAAGRVDGVEVLNPNQVEEALQARVDRARLRNNNNPTESNTRSFWRAELDLANAKRDSEYLVRGMVPADYVQVTPPR